MAAKYSKVERRVHRDEKYRALSRPQPNAQTLWLYLLTCDSQSVFPGLYVLRPAVAADDLQWSIEDFLKSFAEIEAAGMARRDVGTSLVWLPNAVRKNSERLSITNAKGWRNAWNEVPRCELAAAAYRAAVEAFANYEDREVAPKLVEAFTKSPPSWLPFDGGSMGGRGGIEAPSMGGRSQEKEKEKEREREQRRPPPAEHPPVEDLPDLNPEADAVAYELAAGRDLWPDASDLAIASAAERIERIVRCEPAAHGEDASTLAAEAVSYARSWRAGHEGASGAQTLAEAERKVGWLLGDYRLKKRKRGSAPKRSGATADRIRALALASASAAVSTKGAA